MPEETIIGDFTICVDEVGAVIVRFRDLRGPRYIFPHDDFIPLAVAAAKEVTALRQQLVEAFDIASIAAQDVLRERRRQIEKEGWTLEHDDHHRSGSLAQAAACYAMPPEFRMVNLGGCPLHWPWDHRWWKAGDRRRQLVKAAALLLAEIERLDRAAARTESTTNPSGT